MTRNDRLSCECAFRPYREEMGKKFKEIFLPYVLDFSVVFNICSISISFRKYFTRYTRQRKDAGKLKRLNIEKLGDHFSVTVSIDRVKYLTLINNTVSEQGNHLQQISHCFATIACSLHKCRPSIRLNVDVDSFIS